MTSDDDGESMHITNSSIVCQRTWDVAPTMILHFVCLHLSGLEGEKKQTAVS